MSENTEASWLPVVLVWLCLVLLPIGRTVEAPVAIMALLGLWSFARGGWRDAGRGAQRVFGLIMLLLWLPQLFALPDAVHFSRSASGAASFIRFYFAGFYIISSFCSRIAFRRLSMLISLVLGFWVLDAFVQALAGVDLFGFVPQVPSRINGVFGDDLKLGPFLAIYSPILLLYVRAKYNQTIQGLVLLATATVLLLAGSRSSWVMFVFVLGAFFLYQWIVHKNIKIKHLVITAVVACAAVVLCSQFYPPFHAKFEQTALLLKGDRASIDTALSSRLEIWSIAMEMTRDHPINGVGVRGYRYAYPDYAAPDDIWLKRSGGETGAAHPHLLILEIITETGVLGLLGYVGALFLLLRKWFRAHLAEREVLLPFALATLACLLPFNTHMAFYSSSLAQVIYLCMALYCCRVEDDPQGFPADESTAGNPAA